VGPTSGKLFFSYQTILHVVARELYPWPRYQTGAKTP